MPWIYTHKTIDCPEFRNLSNQTVPYKGLQFSIPCHAMQSIYQPAKKRQIFQYHNQPPPLRIISSHFFCAPKFVLIFFASLSPSLSSPGAFLFFFPFPSTAVLPAELALVGVAWFDPLSFTKLVDNGVGALAATGVDDAVGAGESSLNKPISSHPNTLIHCPNQMTRGEELTDCIKLTLLLLNTLFISTTSPLLLAPPGATLELFVYASKPVMIFPCGVSSRYSVSFL